MMSYVVRQCYVVKYMLQSLVVYKQAHVMAQDVEMVQTYCGVIPSLFEHFF